MGVVNVQTDEEKALSSRCRHIRSTCSTSRSSESLIGQRWGEELRVAAGIYRPWDIPSVSRCYHQPCDHRLGTCCCEQGHGYSSVRPLLFPHCTKYCVYPMTRLASDIPTFCHSQGIVLFEHEGSILFKSKSHNGRRPIDFKTVLKGMRRAQRFSDSNMQCHMQIVIMCNVHAMIKISHM